MGRGPVWAEIDLSAVRHNFRQVANHVRPLRAVMAVVKADAYGHGAAEVARAVVEEGAAFLGVSRLGEAAALRQAGVHIPILIFGHTPADQVRKLCDLDLSQTVYSLEFARMLDQAAAKVGCTVDVHLKVDTGMGRIGLRLQDAPPDVFAGDLARLKRFEHLRFSGAFTHFAASDDEDLSSARRQLELFTTVLQQCDRVGFAFSWIHAANSAAIFSLPEAYFDMVRLGISLYGLCPSPTVGRGVVNLHPAMSVKSVLIHVKRVPAGCPIGYSHTYTTDSPTTIGTVSVGYADGYDRLFSRSDALPSSLQSATGGVMLVRGKRVPVVGRVCMDHAMIDLANSPDATVGDEVVLIGSQGDARISADEAAERSYTISHEVVSRMSSRVRRIYLE